MATAPRAFRRQVKEKTIEERPTVAFDLDWIADEIKEGEEEAEVIRSDTFHATKPTEERLFLVAALIGDEDGGHEATAVLDIFRDALPRDEFLTLKERLIDPDDDVNLDMLQDVLMWLMSEWTDFPTKPSTGSSGSRGNSGARSTGRVRGKASTR